ncbi:MAG: hypothetical protein EOM58_06540 [Clostridia bacterium]|nr:hypothetical protein [Clostridia bacterium]
MVRIHAPNKNYNGTSASVAFQQGVGETDDPTLIAWFQSRGYRVELPQEAPPEEPPQAPVKPAPQPAKKRKGE